MTKATKAAPRKSRTKSAPKVHPLVLVSENFSRADISKALGHSTHATAAIYIARAKRDPDFKVPAHWAFPLARLSGLDPHAFRPDLYLEKWTWTV
jgi:hypothetical protein